MEKLLLFSHVVGRCTRALCAYTAFGVLMSLAVAHAEPTEAVAFRARESLALRDLEGAVTAGNADLEISRRNLGVARAAQAQARLYGNPSLDAAWGTVPVGKLNPRDLNAPYANVPNYSVGVSYTVPIRKRAPRIAGADAQHRARLAEVTLDTKSNALALADVLGTLASSQLREAGLLELLDNARRSVELVTASLGAGYGTPLDVERLRVDLERTEQQVLAVRGITRDALESCSLLVGVPCTPFESGDSARAYLDAWVARVTDPPEDLTDRADLRALDAYAAASRADRDAAKAEAIPDPTVRLGYMHDRFIVAGNQRNSLNLSVSLPLPIFDHGQAKEQAARIAQQHFQSEREKRLAATRASLPQLLARVAGERERCARVRSITMPRARGVLRDLEAASESRLIPVTDVIQARRTVAELFVEEADSCADAYTAALGVLRAVSAPGVLP